MLQQQAASVYSIRHDPCSRSDRLCARMQYHRSCRNSRIRLFSGCKYLCSSTPLQGEPHLQQLPRLPKQQTWGMCVHCNHAKSMLDLHSGEYSMSSSRSLHKNHDRSTRSGNMLSQQTHQGKLQGAEHGPFQTLRS